MGVHRRRRNAYSTRDTRNSQHYGHARVTPTARRHVAKLLNLASQCHVVGGTHRARIGYLVKDIHIVSPSIRVFGATVKFPSGRCWQMEC
jgi:hypothetical protein